MNETIKTQTEITVEEAGEMLRDNGWKPVKGLAFRDKADPDWNVGVLDSLNTAEGERPFGISGNGFWHHCAKVTELDPCKAPEGCPELESWMAYVGFTDVDPLGTHVSRSSDISGSSYAFDANSGEWVKCYYNLKDHHYAIDVRTEWAQEHFPDHCRIRNYKEPSPIAKGHNPWNLTEEQVGVSEGWRLTTEDEVGLNIDKSLLQYWNSYRGWVKPSCITPGMFKGCTYRTKKPEGYFLPKPDAFEEWINERFGGRSILDDSNCFLLGSQMKELFELGQKNPIK